jgi:protoporphyrin/coproporphyrin ferrochelatase
MASRGLLLMNLGTPDAPTTPAVRRYLAEFLADPRVIDINPVMRWLLLHLIILRTRPKLSAEAYQKIWTEAGSPLLVNSKKFTAALEAELQGRFQVQLGMRYGNPSLEFALKQLITKRALMLVLFPLYPQYAASSTASSLARVSSLLARGWDVPAIKVVPAFYAHPAYLNAFAEVIQPVVRDTSAEYLLFSFHGLPERQIRRSDPTGRTCLASEQCCDQIRDVNANCYRAQAHATARGLAQRLGVAPSQFSVSFQSRLGGTPWIKPYTDEVLPALVGRGVKRVAVICPSFVADCLETLEEIGIRGRQSFLGAGGEELVLVPSLNSHPTWVRAAAQIVDEATG